MSKKQQSRSGIVKWMLLGAALVGLLFYLRAPSRKFPESGPESCNGYSDSDRDYHLWITDGKEDSKAEGIVVEITPRWKVAHPEWRLRFLQALAQQRSRVRVTGWILWDEEHGNEVEHSR